MISKSVFGTGFVKVMPHDYKRALLAIKRAKEQGTPWEVAVMEGAHG